MYEPAGNTVDAGAERRPPAAAQARAQARAQAALPRPPDVVLFDLDGTLVDTRAGFVLSVNHTLEQFGCTPREPQELWGYLGPPTQTTFGTLLGQDGPIVAAAVDAYRSHYTQHGAELATLYDGVRELIEALHGRARLAVATSKEVGTAQNLLERLGVTQRFEVVRGPSRSAIDEAKATTLAAALEALNAHAPVRAPVMIGDRRYDVEGAAAHSIPTVGVLWGAGSAEELRAAGAAALVERPDEVPVQLAL